MEAEQLEPELEHSHATSIPSGNLNTAHNILPLTPPFQPRIVPNKIFVHLIPYYPLD